VAEEQQKFAAQKADSWRLRLERPAVKEATMASSALPRSCCSLLTKKAPYKGLGADSEEKREPVSDIDTAAADGLKVLDPKRPIREADMPRTLRKDRL